MKKTASCVLLLLACLLPSLAHAWWNGDWAQRRKVSIDTSTSGVETKEALTQVPLAVRLHSGNFAFADAKEDGSDLRFVAGDDKTPLKYHVERFDSVNELALVWVQLPKLAPGSNKENIWLYFGNPKATAAEDIKGSYDASYAAVFHFAEKDGAAKDSSANANTLEGQVASESGGLLGASARIAGTPLRLAAAPALRLAAGGELAVSAWIKPAATVQKAALYAQEADGKSVVLGVESGKLVARIAGGAKPLDLSGGEIKPDVWQHVALAVGGGHASIYVNGVAVAAGDGGLPDMQAPVSIGNGLAGSLDELQISGVARSADWVKAMAASQGQDGNLLSVAKEGEEGGGGTSYFGILISNLTTDAWVVIGILMVMFAISVVIMVGKARFVSRTERSNNAFLHRFRAGHANLLTVGDAAPASFGSSSLYRLYGAGLRELNKRFATRGGAAAGLSAQSIGAIKASIDADLVRETHRLNSKMVLLTIAISGGPFLGLLGTVVGVMITFAAIAAAGDVNVNSIAPGIAAALLATVAGLAVAIPALFGYNYLASRIKNITAEMQIFVDEFVTRVAEDYCA